MIAQDLGMSAPSKKTSDVTQHHFWYTHWSNHPLDSGGQGIDLSTVGMTKKKRGGYILKPPKVSQP